jgi:two-component system, cell cycle sensor histidine kinase and response regulator CckA
MRWLRVCRAVARLLEVPMCGVVVPEGTDYVTEICLTADARAITRRTLRRIRCTASTVIDTHRAVLVPDLRHTHASRDTKTPEGAIAFAATPLRLESLGNCALWVADVAPRAWTDRDRGRLDDAAALLAADLSFHEAAEDALAQVRRSEEYFRSITEQASEMIAILDAQGITKYESPSNSAVLGYAADELVGTSPFELMHPDDVPNAQLAFSRALASPGVPLRTELRYRHKDGSYRTLAIVAKNLLDDPVIGGIVLTSRDITESRAVRDQLYHAQKMEALGRLAGGIAHDFNNLLTAIKGTTQLVMQDVGSDDPVRADLAILDDAADRAARLTKQLLTFGRRQEATPAIIDLNALVTEMGQLLARLLPAHIRVETTLDPHLLRTSADPSHLEQVIVNLVLNARDAMPSGGILRIETAMVTLDAAAQAPAGTYVVLRVCDNGIGMDAATVARIFEPFYTTKEASKGSGLGLATVYGIVEQSGGFIRVKSDIGRGSEFAIHLPATAERVEAPAADAPPSNGHICATILVVEDDESVRGFACRALERLGHRVLEVATADEAFALIARTSDPIDLVLADIVMPGMSGRELAVRLSIERPDLRLLLMSGHTDEAVSLESAQTAVPFLQKPFSVERLAITVGQALLREEGRGKRG